MVNEIKVLALDIDGVLTDGTDAVGDASGSDKRISFHDLDAVNHARAAGLKVVFVTGESGGAVEAITQRFGISDGIAGAKDKAAALDELSERLRIPLSAFCYVGDSDRDAPGLARSGLALAPANASQTAKAAAHRVLAAKGGAGAVAEAVRLVLDAAGQGQQRPALIAAMKEIAESSIEAHRRLLDESLPVLVDVAIAFTNAIRAGHKILLFGNGGSAADAQHVAGELVGRFLKESPPWAAIALTTDSSILTCVGNDWTFDDVFARQVRALCKPGDVVVGITTSGRSPNVIRGLQDGRKCGATTVGFTGAKGTALTEHADICFLAPADATPRIQELHLLAWHSICELVERELLKS